MAKSLGLLLYAQTWKWGFGSQNPMSLYGNQGLEEEGSGRVLEGSQQRVTAGRWRERGVSLQRTWSML